MSCPSHGQMGESYETRRTFQAFSTPTLDPFCQNAENTWQGIQRRFPPLMTPFQQTFFTLVSHPPSCIALFERMSCPSHGQIGESYETCHTFQALSIPTLDAFCQNVEHTRQGIQRRFLLLKTSDPFVLCRSSSYLAPWKMFTPTSNTCILSYVGIILNPLENPFITNQFNGYGFYRFKGFNGGQGISWVKGSLCFVLKFALPPFSLLFSLCGASFKRINSI